jgi:rubrerythrin
MARVRERSQTVFYRRLAVLAEEAGLETLGERLNGLHADEQHHLSRVTARLIELGERPAEMSPPPSPAELEGWEAEARAREGDEVAFYDRALARQDLDERTRAIFREIVASERRHRTELGGKWMSA